MLEHRMSLPAEERFNETVSWEPRELVYNMVNCDKPIVSAINGVAVGAGMAVALLADISVIAADVRLTEGHMRIGLVSRCTEPGGALDEARRVARSLAAGPQWALRWTKRTMNNWLRLAGPTFDASLAFEMLTFFGEDAQEGLKALADKREPAFPSTRA